MKPELEIYLAGIGGQGIQLMAKILALAALAEQRHVQLSAEYGFMMRGGSSLATVVLGAEDLRALPVVASAGAALILHPQYLDTPAQRLRPDALVVTDHAIAAQLPVLPTRNIIAVEASATARQIGNAMVAGLVMLSAFNSITGLLRTDSLVEAMRSLVPSYRRQHLAANEAALRQGAALATRQHPFDLDTDIRRAA